MRREESDEKRVVLGSLLDCWRTRSSGRGLYVFAYHADACDSRRSHRMLKREANNF